MWGYDVFVAVSDGKARITWVCGVSLIAKVNKFAFWW
jgi:hypothetical protein